MNNFRLALVTVFLNILNDVGVLAVQTKLSEGVKCPGGHLHSPSALQNPPSSNEQSAVDSHRSPTAPVSCMIQTPTPIIIFNCNSPIRYSNEKQTNKNIKLKNLAT